MREANTQIREQNSKIQSQIDKQARDTFIVRRAQLLETIYACQEEDQFEEADGTGGSGDESEAAGNESEIPFAEPSCQPKAHIRARQEAVRAFVEIEQGRGVWADAQATNLRTVNLTKANLNGADLSLAILDGVDFNGANLDEANLYGASLVMAYLTEASLRKADLSQADLAGTILRGADLSGAELSAARNLTQGQINLARGDAGTQLPQHLRRPAHWTKASDENP